MSRLAVGSSSIRISGSCTRPLDIDTFCLWPADSSLKLRFMRSSISMAFSAFTATWMSLDVVRHFWWENLPMSTVSKTDITLKSEVITGTYPTTFDSSLREYSSRFLPMISTVPDVGLIMPSISLTNVDLPTPLGPMIHTKPGSSSSKVMPERISLSPYPQWTSFNDIMLAVPPPSSA